METKILLSGFGGQGILFTGKVLAYSGLLSGKKVSWLPSYGPEMRGGTASCSVIISDNEVASPIIATPDILICMNQPSFDKFAATTAENGTIIIDSSIVSTPASPNIKGINATEIATANEIKSLANMIILGKLLKETALFTLEEIQKGLEKSIPASKKELATTNLSAIQLGFC